MPRAKNLVEVYNNFVVEPLKTEEEFKEFYVERSKEAQIVEEIRDRIENSIRKEKYLFLGFRGSGKSTELNKLSLKLLNKNRFIIIKYSVRDILDVNDFDVRDFFASMALKIYETAEEMEIEIMKDLKRDFKKFMMKITRVEEREIKETKGFGLTFSKFLILKIGREAETRKYVRKELRTRISELIQRQNILIEEIENESDKRVVVIIDDLDKLTRGEQADEFFYKNYSLLLKPNCFVIYTFPVPLAFNPFFENVRQSFDGCFILPQHPIKDRKGNIIKENLKFYKRVAEKRMDLSLIDEDALEEAIISTGKLGEFISIIRDSAIKAYRNKKTKITSEEIRESLEKLRRIYDRTITEEHKKRLIEIHERKEARDRDISDTITRELLFSLTAVEYEDKEGRWCDVNPILLPLLKRWKKEMKRKF